MSLPESLLQIVVLQNATAEAIYAASGVPPTEASIYRITKFGEASFYIGSTTLTIAQRLSTHRVDAKKHQNQRVYRFIAENGGWSDDGKPTSKSFGIETVAEVMIHGEPKKNLTLKIIERAFQRVLVPPLNSIAAMLTPAERLEYAQTAYARRKARLAIGV